MKITIRTREIPPDIELLPNLHPVLARLYAMRGIRHVAELEKHLKKLIPAQALKGLEPSLELLEKALQESWRILVVGDFDADGATSTALSVLVLRAMGATVDYLVPNRFEYGYGLTPEIVALAKRTKNPDLIITVDNGISSIEGVEAAHHANIRVLVTDHHLPGKTLPAADAIVNPNQPGCAFPSKSIAGVGVVFYVLAALRTRLREKGWFTQQKIVEPAITDYLDIVALGTVADVVSLDSNNRILVQQGMQRIRAGHCRPGISALLAIANKKNETAQTSDLSFQVAPRLNAAGRLDDMSLGIECLLSDSPPQAAQLAAKLDELNIERRQIEHGMQQEAMHALQHLKMEGKKLPAGMVLFDPNWHQGVIGILAGRIKERFHRPVIAFAPVVENGVTLLKGSARSIAGVHIRDVLDTMAATHPGLISRFGGHAMAAGLVLPQANLPLFRQIFQDTIAKLVQPDDLGAILLSDGELPAECFSEVFAELIQQAGPWGQGFPEPLFHGEFLCLDQRILKEKHLKLSLSHPDSNRVVDAIAFNADLTVWSKQVERVRLAYRLDINEFRGVRSVQLMVSFIEPVEVTSAA
jgi:single-stranded-DNA-specific exonuclease